VALALSASRLLCRSGDASEVHGPEVLGRLGESLIGGPGVVMGVTGTGRRESPVSIRLNVPRLRVAGQIADLGAQHTAA
jgi:hypothetical protein